MVKMRQQKQANSRTKAIMMAMGEQQKPGSLRGHQPTWVKLPMSRVVDRKLAWRPKNHTEGPNVHIVMCFKCARPATHIWELKQVACGVKRHSADKCYGQQCKRTAGGKDKIVMDGT
eukprot:2129706-Karenia_brevis.AAC.1